MILLCSHKEVFQLKQPMKNVIADDKVKTERRADITNFNISVFTLTVEQDYGKVDSMEAETTLNKHKYWTYFSLESEGAASAQMAHTIPFSHIQS